MGEELNVESQFAVPGCPVVLHGQVFTQGLGGMGQEKLTVLLALS